MVKIEVIGLAKGSALDPARWAGFGQALFRGGQAIQAEMQLAAKPHRYHGRLEQNIHVEGPSGTGLNTEVRVGITTASTPEGRPLAFGWASTSGRRPPVEPIARWLVAHPEILTKANAMPASSRGNAMIFRNASGFIKTRATVTEITQESKIRSLAFAIAKSIGKRGYSFGRADWFHDGIRAGKPRLDAIVREALRIPRSKP